MLAKKLRLGALSVLQYAMLNIIAPKSNKAPQILPTICLSPYRIIFIPALTMENFDLQNQTPL